MAVLQVYKVHGPLIFPPTSAVPQIMVRIGHTWSEFGFFLGKLIRKRSEMVTKSLIFTKIGIFNDTS